MKVICQICGEKIGDTHLRDLRYPMTGAMFTSIDPVHEYPAPFDASLTWEHFRCPYGPHRPMIEDNKVYTDEGMVVLPRDGDPAYIDPRQKNEVERESIADRMLTVSDADAERIARETIAQQEGAGNGEAEEEPGEPEDTKPVEGKDKKVYPCSVCGKEYGNETNMMRHRKQAHKGRK